MDFMSEPLSFHRLELNDLYKYYQKPIEVPSVFREKKSTK